MDDETADSVFPCTAADGVRLHVRRWVSEGATKALAVVVHGIVEHGGRYAEMAGSLRRAGITVWAPDARGHGRSSGSRVWVDRFDRYMEDLSIVVDEARATDPDLPLFLIGHSMGALIVLRAALTMSNIPAGLILSAPPISVSESLFPWLRRLAVFGSRWFPRLRLARMGSSMLSRDSEVIAQFRADPLVFHGRIPARTGAEILRISEEICQRASDVTLPMLILQGTADAVVSAQATESFYQAAGSGDKTLRLYPGLYHDLPREPEKEEICTEMINWILGRC